MTTRSKASAVQRSRPLRTVARVGYAVSGLVYLLIGFLALATAFGGDEKTDEQGALAQIAEQPFGLAVLWIVVIGFAGLALFHLLEASLEHGAKDRLTAVGRAIAYAFLCFVTVRVVLGQTSSDAPGTLSATLLAQPAGVALLLLVAAGILALGVRNIVKGIKHSFTDDLAMPPKPTSTGIIVLGTAGYVAKGIAFVTIGVLFAVAALTSNAAEAGGLDQALEKLALLPFGPIVLGVVALGFIAFGLYCFVRARYARL